jgi:hypothetical protein
MLRNKLDRAMPIRSFHPAANFVRRARAAPIDAQLRSIPKDVNMRGRMVVCVDTNHEPFDNDPRHRLIITYHVRFLRDGAGRLLADAVAPMRHARRGQPSSLGTPSLLTLSSRFRTAGRRSKTLRQPSRLGNRTRLSSVRPGGRQAGVPAGLGPMPLSATVAQSLADRLWRGQFSRVAAPRGDPSAG